MENKDDAIVSRYDEKMNGLQVCVKELDNIANNLESRLSKVLTPCIATSVCDKETVQLKSEDSKVVENIVDLIDQVSDTSNKLIRVMSRLQI